MTANFDDGSVVDATPLAVYASTDAAAVEADAAGRLKIGRRGRHAVIVRYLSEVRTVQVTVPLADTAVDLSATGQVCAAERQQIWQDIRRLIEQIAPRSGRN